MRDIRKTQADWLTKWLLNETNLDRLNATISASYILESLQEIEIEAQEEQMILDRESSVGEVYAD